MIRIDILSAETLDYEQWAKLQLSAFGELMGNRYSTSFDFMTPKFYRWKYNTPFGAAKIVVATQEKRPIGGRALVPWPIMMGNTLKIIHQSCDSAVLPSHQGKGVYSKVQRFTIDNFLQPGQFLFSFPNLNSIGAYKRAGGVEADLIGTFINPLPHHFYRWQKFILKKVHQFDKAFDFLALEMSERSCSMVCRNAEYLTWRYKKHPHFKYHPFVLLYGNKLAGYVVLRTTTIARMKFCIIMELCGKTRAVRHQLLRQSKIWAAKKNISKVAMLNNHINFKDFLSAGFIKIPHLFLPKKQALIILYKDTRRVPGQSTPWCVGTGDWDAF